MNRFEDKGEVWSINKVAFRAGSMHVEWFKLVDLKSRGTVVPSSGPRPTLVFVHSQLVCLQLDCSQSPIFP